MDYEQSYRARYFTLNSIGAMVAFVVGLTLFNTYSVDKVWIYAAAFAFCWFTAVAVTSLGFMGSSMARRKV